MVNIKANITPIAPSRPIVCITRSLMKKRDRTPIEVVMLVSRQASAVLLKTERSTST